MQELIVRQVDAQGEVQTGVPLVNDFEIVKLHKAETTSRKLVSFELRITIILWISDCSFTFSDY